jgi:hypothetical protein
VALGDSRLDLLGKCGPPALQEAEPVVGTVWVDPSLAIERWTYNFGPSRFLQIVSLRGGKVIAVERGSYGYPPPDSPKDAPREPATIPRARCTPDAFRVGDRTLDVLARCGEPVYRDLRPGQAAVEIWTYDFGQQTFVRFVEFQNGTVIRIRTGSYGYSR